MRKLVFVLLLAACSSSPVAPSAVTDGTYTLVAFNGQPLPARIETITLPDTIDFTVDAGQLVVSGNSVTLSIATRVEGYPAETWTTDCNLNGLELSGGNLSTSATHRLEPGVNGITLHYVTETVHYRYAFR